jgi:bifunctional non-homologous end joining protein LigD
MTLCFIPPCSPIAAKKVPAGEAWLHEVKFDGYRVQVHKHGRDVVTYSRNGHGFTERFAIIAQLLRELPAKTAVLDGEIVANNPAGAPDFRKLHRRSAEAGDLHLWVFDVLALNGKDVRAQPLLKRKDRLEGLLARFDCPTVRVSEVFEDGIKLLGAAERHELEGVVSKRRDAPYRSGECRDWVKVKTAAWREANRERWRLFERT